MNTKAPSSRNTPQQKPVLVIGANGKTGMRIINKLQAQGIHYRAVGRSTQPSFNWQQPDQWARALQNVRAVYVTYAPDLAMPQAPEDIRLFCETARKQGVEQIVLLSGRGEPEAQHCERIVQRSGMSWTIIRASWFLQNFTEGDFAPMIAEGVIALPITTVREPFIDIDDIAEIALAALTSDKHLNQVYEVTGPQLLSFSELADLFSQLLGKPIQCIPLTLAQFTDQLQQQSVPQNTISMLTYLFQEVLDGRNAFTTQGVQQALSREATNPLIALKRDHHR